MSQDHPLVMGIDPGTLRTGYGIITLEPHPRPVAHGAIAPARSLPLEERLHLIHQELLGIIDRHAPARVAVEEPDFGKSPRSSMAVGQALAVALIAAASRKIPVTRFQPSQVKQAATDSGGSTKEQVRLGVQARLLIPGLLPQDAADALAAALAAADLHRLAQLTGQA